MFAIARSDPLLPAPFSPGPFAIVAVSDALRPQPTWRTMFGWPADDARAIPLSARSRGERKIWAARFDRAICSADRPVLIVADGLGCAASAWWGRLSPADYVSRVAGALLFAPREQADAGDGEAGLFASPTLPLPFPSVVIQPHRTDIDPQGMIDHWGSRLIAGRRERHVTAETRAWRQAQRLFLRMTHQLATYEVGRAEAMIGR